MRLSRRLLGASADFFSENLRVDFFNGKILRAEGFFSCTGGRFFWDIALGRVLFWGGGI